MRLWLLISFSEIFIRELTSLMNCLALNWYPIPFELQPVNHGARRRSLSPQWTRGSDRSSFNTNITPQKYANARLIQQQCPHKGRESTIALVESRIQSAHCSAAKSMAETPYYICLIRIFIISFMIMSFWCALNHITETWEIFTPLTPPPPSPPSLSPSLSVTACVSSNVANS